MDQTLMFCFLNVQKDKNYILKAFVPQILTKLP